MRKSVLKTIFNFSFAYLSQLADRILLLIERDSSVLANYGVDDDLKASIAESNQALKEMPTDEEWMGDVSDATEKKDASGEAVKTVIRDIMVRAKKVFGEHSAKYRKFGTKGMDELKDHDLYRCATRVARVASTYLSQLSAKGLTQDIIDDLKAKAAQYDIDLTAKEDFVADRDVATEERIILANSIYTKLVEVCDYGRTYWSDKSEAKYNDYVIYNTADGKAPAEGTVFNAHGKVTDAETQAPLAGASVLFDGVAEPAITNASGEYDVKGIPMTSLFVKVTADGYIDSQETINPTAGEDNVIDIQMEAGENPA
jgi:hypothetical protein